MTWRRSSTFALIASATPAPRAAQLEFGFGRCSRQNVAHRLNARGKALIDAACAAVGGVGHVGDARVNDARALVDRLGEGGQAGVERLRALSCGVGDVGPARVECVADRGLVHLEQCGDLLRIAVCRVRHFGHARVNRACALIRGLGEGGQAGVKRLRALSCGVGDDGSVRVDRGAD